MFVCNQERKMLSWEQGLYYILCCFIYHVHGTWNACLNASLVRLKIWHVVLSGHGEGQDPMLDLFWQLKLHLDWPEPCILLLLSEGLF